MRNLLLSFVCFLMVSAIENYSQDNNFDVVFTAPHWEINYPWLEKITAEWGATGVCMYVHWGSIEIKEGNFNYWAADTFIDTIIKYSNIYKKPLKIYLRVIMGGYWMPDWVKPSSSGNPTPFTHKDFFTTKNSVPFSQYGISPLNFASETSKYYLYRFYSNLVKHISEKYSSSQIIEFVPSITPDSETEFPYLEMCGYSQPEVDMFREYLKTKYVNLYNLNKRWGSDYKSWNEIEPSLYNWDLVRETQLQINYMFPAGRIDWLQFRKELLKQFIDNCAEITHQYNGFKMGVQIGSIYDDVIEKRGWYDPVSLFENVDAIRHDDIVEYEPNHNFSADYLRSICNYWTQVNGRRHTFSSEITWHNWPCADPKNLSCKGYGVSLLDQEYTDQLETFYYNGAKEIYLTQWSLPSDTLSFLESQFPLLKNTLQYLSNKPVQNIYNPKAVHLSCEQGPFEGVYGVKTFGVYKSFTLFNSVLMQSPFLSNADVYDHSNSDIITNFMIGNSPEYLSKYSTFSFTKGSLYIPCETNLKLMNALINFSLINTSMFNTGILLRNGYIQGLKNEYNDSCGVLR